MAPFGLGFVKQPCGGQSIFAWHRFCQSIVSHLTPGFGDGNLGRYSIRVVNADALLRWKIAPSRR